MKSLKPLLLFLGYMQRLAEAVFALCHEFPMTKVLNVHREVNVPITLYVYYFRILCIRHFFGGKKMGEEP